MCKRRRPRTRWCRGPRRWPRVAIQNEFYLTDWRGRFKHTPEELSLFHTSCTVGGGDATGMLDVKISQQNSPFVLDTNFSKVNLDRLLADAGVTQLQASGIISGFVHLEGDSRDSSRAQGEGQIVLANGYLSKSDFSDNLNLLLHTDKFRGMHLDDAHANFHVESGKIYLDDLVLKSSALTFTSKGVMDADGMNLYVLCRLAISAGIARQIPDFLLENFGTDEKDGTRYVDFPIAGDINHPHYSGPF